MAFDEGRLRELQSALRAKMADQKSLADSFQIDGSTVVVSSEQKSAFDRNMADIREIKSLIDSMESMRDLDAWAAAPITDSVAAAAAAAGYAIPAGAKSLGQLFIESAEFKSLQGGRNGANMPTPFTLAAKDLTGTFGKKDIYSALPTGTPGSFGTIQRDPMVLEPMRTRRVRDLFPTRTTSAAVIEYFRVTGFSNNAASAGGIAERSGNNFGLKPQSQLQFVGSQSPVRTLAHWEAAHRNVLADEPQLRSIIDNELLYGLRLAEDAQILSGDGNGDNLLGILNTPGIQQYGLSDGENTDTYADAIRRACTLSFLAYYEPSGIVLHPNDWERIELTKDEQGRYLVAVSVAMGGEPRLWRLPVVDTPAIAEGTALVGSFGQGAQIYDREQASIRISEQHSDFFVRNAVVILAEQRLALATKRPESFVKVDFNG